MAQPTAWPAGASTACAALPDMTDAAHVTICAAAATAPKHVSRAQVSLSRAATHSKPANKRACVASAQAHGPGAVLGQTQHDTHICEACSPAPRACPVGSAASHAGHRDSIDMFGCQGKAFAASRRKMRGSSGRVLQQRKCGWDTRKALESNTKGCSMAIQGSAGKWAKRVAYYVQPVARGRRHMRAGS